MQDISRRRFVQATGATVAVGAFAGCTGDGNGGNGNGNGNGNDDTETEGGNGGGDTDVPQAIDDHLSDANLYEGTIADHTGEDEVTIAVGGGEGLAFDPPAVRVDSGTTIVWEWTGDGGSHNVASVEGSDSEFSSEYYSSEGETYENSFDSAGVQLYVCEPHRTQGMKGALEIV
ncbi:MAG: halocyanin-like protein [Natronomonas sp.]|jgi:halocyanin-like protein